ncbi:DNA helicase [Sinirhodobacter populi]|nr:DNA helicase [Sinirhodobacter populi]
MPLNLLQSFETAPAPMDLVLPGMIAGTVGSLVASGGVGKSWLALELAVAVAGGPDLIEMGIPKTGRVLYLPAEDPREALAHRVHAVGEYMSKEQKEVVASNMRILPLMGHQVDLMSGESKWAEALEESCESTRLTIIDTLRRFHFADENASGEMAALLGVMERICERTGTSILFLHHTAKAFALNGAGGEQQASRGSSVLVDNLRGGQWNLLGMSEVEAEKRKIEDRKRFVKLTQSKANFGAPIADAWLERGIGGVLIPATPEISDGTTSDKVTPLQNWRGKNGK